jgi:crossover junction endodeoxyribonuclease RusA
MKDETNTLARVGGGNGLNGLESRAHLCTLPWPPATLSPNARQHYQALARAKKAYRSACWYTAHSQGLRKIEASRVHVDIVFVPPNKRGFDLDNLLARMKSGLDALADVIGVDDKHWSLSIRRADEIGGMVRISITEV